MKSGGGNIWGAKADNVPSGKGRRYRRILQCEDGGALVEAAFVLPVLIALMIGIFEISLYTIIATGTESAALVGSQTFAGARGGTSTAVTAATAAVNAVMCTSVANITASNITVKMTVNGTQCSTCTGSSKPNCASLPATNATCTGSCDTALTNAAPNPSTNTYTLSSVSVQTGCSGFGFLKALPLTCPITSQVYGVVQ
jgi:Flp pilus assembly protein TadG